MQWLVVNVNGINNASSSSNQVHKKTKTHDYIYKYSETKVWFMTHDQNADATAST